MLLFKRSSGILISKKYENEYFYMIIKKFLTRSSRNFDRKSYTITEFFQENEKYLLIPRYFPLENFCKFSFEIEDIIGDGLDININHHIKLRDELQLNIVNFLINNKKGLLKAVPGSGKTITTIYVIATLKKKSLILVHKDNLVDQWIGPGTEEDPQGFLSFTDINPKKIKRLTSLNYKKVLSECDIIVTTSQTFFSLLKRDKINFQKALFNSEIGIFVGDEVHTSIGAPSFSKCSIYVPSKITIGLSATPYRWDGNGDIIEYHMGNIFIPEGEASVMDARVTIFFLDFGIIKKSSKYVYFGGNFYRPRYLNLLKNSKILNEFLISLIKKVYKDKRDIIVMSERKNHIQLLFDKLPKEMDKVKFIGSEKNNILKSKLVFSTPLKIRDGVDIPKKDCLITTSPISNIEQLSGRVVRSKKDKNIPIIIEIVDIGCLDIRETLLPRISFYESKKWNIRYVYVNEKGKFEDLTKEEVINVIGK